MIEMGDHHRYILLASVVAGAIALSPQSGLAQIRPDNTLPTHSIVTRQGNRLLITGGTQQASNLFHSFEEFSVAADDIASFRLINASVTNLFSRVTGSVPSTINGTIEVLQNDGTVSSANLFLLNPNGILFGAEATLNVGGSVLATTADRITFADGTQFSAIAPEASALLTVSVPVGLQFGQTPGRIVNQSRVPLVDSSGTPILDNGNPIPAGLQVRPGQTLGFFGGEVVFPGGILTAASGRIEVGSVGSGSKIRLTQTQPPEWVAGYDGVQQFGPIQLTQASALDVSGSPEGGGGFIRIQGDRVVITEESLIFANNLSSQAGRGITIRANQLLLNAFAYLSASSFASGAGGTIRITADQIQVRDGAQIEANANAEGPGGNLLITAFDGMHIDGGRLLGETFFPSGLFARVTGDASGRGGNVVVTTPQLTLSAGAQIATDTFGAGNAGNMTINAEAIALTGIGRAPDGMPLFLTDGRPRSPSGLVAGSFASGRGSTLTVTTGRLQLRDGAVIQTSTQGSGQAGELQIRATESVELSGTAPGSSVPTGLLTFSGGIPGTDFDLGNPAVTGKGSALSVVTPELLIRDGAVAAAGSLNATANAAGAGTVRLQVARLRLENRGRVLTATASGNGGNIAIRASDFILLRQGSEISTTAGIAGVGGNGGNIQIETGILLAGLSENSDITANAFTGNGGNITIITEALLGIAARDRLTSANDITASSELGGLAGTISISSPEVDLSAAVPELPAVPTTGQLTQGCQLEGGDVTAQFFNTGRGGLPPNPLDPISRLPLLEDLRLPVQTPTLEAAHLIEAQGWQRSQTGAVQLVADQRAIAPTHACSFRSE